MNTTDTAAWLSALTAILALLLLLGLYLNARRAARRDQARLVADLSNRWRDLHDHWNTALMVARGPDDVYHDVEPQKADQYAEIKAEIAELDSEATRVMNTPKEGQTLEERYADVSSALRPLFDAQRRLGPYGTSVRVVLRFLAEVSGSILRGHARPEMIYEAFGTQIARNGGAIRFLVEKQHTVVDPGLRLRAVILIDLMWAEAARIGELSTLPDQPQAAKLKELTGTGRRNLRRCRYMARRLGGWRTSRQLSRLMRYATRRRRPVPWEKFFKVPKPGWIDFSWGDFSWWTSSEPESEGPNPTDSESD